jgi:ribonuclease T1
MNPMKLFATLLLALLLTAAAIYTQVSVARESPAKGNTAIGKIAVAELPQQGREALALIRKGGPFPYSKDGTVFGNRERILPKKDRGFYKEYTVKTPGSRDRGARRIVCGGEVTIPTKSTCYYTDDHYASFKQIKE